MNGINPYAPPAEAISPPQETEFKGEKHYSTKVIVFHPTILTPVVAILFGIILLVGTAITLTMATESFSSPKVDRLMILFSIFGVLGTLLSFIVTWIRVAVFTDGVQKRDLSKKMFPFASIRSWRQDPRTGFVELSLTSQPQPVKIRNWAMNKRNSNQLARILSEKIGSPEAH